MGFYESMMNTIDGYIESAKILHFNGMHESAMRIYNLAQLMKDDLNSFTIGEMSCAIL